MNTLSQRGTEAVLAKTAAYISHYKDAQVSVTADPQPVHGYLFIRICGSGLDNYNYELLGSVWSKVFRSGLSRVAVDLGGLSYVAQTCFDANVLKPALLCAQLGGNMIVGNLRAGHCADFVRLLGYEDIMNFPLDVRKACADDMPCFGAQARANRKNDVALHPYPGLSEALEEWDRKYRGILPWRDNPWPTGFGPCQSQ